MTTPAAALLLAAACTTVQTYEYGPGEIPAPDSRRRIVAVTRTSGVRVTFDRGLEDGPVVPDARIEERAILGTDGQPLRVDLSDTRSVWVEESRTAFGRTLLLAAGLGVGIPFLLRQFD